MQRAFTVNLCLSIAVLLSTAGRSCAWGDSCGGCVQYVDQIKTYYRAEVRCRDVAHVVPRTVCREVPDTKTVLITTPVYDTQKRTVYVYAEEKKEVERTVHVALPECVKPACGAAGCNGCGAKACGSCTDICKPPVQTHALKIKTYECEAAAKPVEFSETVCTYKVQEKIVPCTKTISAVVNETVVRKKFYTVMVPYQVCVKVPVCVPATCPCH